MGDRDDDGATYDEHLREQRLTFPHQTPDVMLAAFVAGGERMPDLWVTVLVGGVWITGRVVHNADWLAAVALDHPDSPLREAAAMEHAQEHLDTIEIEGRLHLHLFDAEMLTPAGDLSPIGAPLRVRLVAVDGWFLGRFGAGVANG